MPIPREQLSRPLFWEDDALEPLLSDLQANILKGHGRHHTVHRFLRFDAARKAAIRQVLAGLPLTSALQQLKDTDRHKADGAFDGGPVVLLFLTHQGYRKLGVSGNRTPTDAAFAAGMANRPALLDPAIATWDEPYRAPIDALLLVADKDAASAAAAAAPLMAALVAAGVAIQASEEGAALFRGKEGIEHFGYVDGRSQPLLLDEDVVRELNLQGEPFIWDPQSSPLEMALVEDPGGATDDSFGSYFVFRKLEQDVAGFKNAEDILANVLQLVAPDARALAGALVVGRFEDGTPVVASKRSLGKTTVANNFTYSGDPNADRCPFQSHIRKSNPRGDSIALGATLAQERGHLMPRRGITYGQRAPDLSDQPTHGVGLLFMAYNAEIERQFEFTQSAWVNNPNFVRNGTGRDAVLGTGAAGHKWPKQWDTPQSGTEAFDFGAFVTLKGGEYFFAPSLSFVAGLGTQPN